MSMFDDDIFNKENDIQSELNVDTNIDSFSSKNAKIGAIVFKNNNTYTINRGEACAIIATKGYKNKKRVCLVPEQDAVFSSESLTGELWNNIDSATLNEIYNKKCGELKNKQKEKNSNHPKKFILQCLSHFPIRKNKTHHDDDIDTSEMNMSKDEITTKYGINLQDILKKVHNLNMTEDMIEKSVTKLNDLYKTLEVVCIVPKKEGSDYGWCDDVLGCYTKKEDKSYVYIFLETIREHYSSSEELRNAVISTYIHELYHAYFDWCAILEPINSNIPRYIEEPIVEYLTIETLKKLDKKISNWYREEVAKKLESPSCRQYALGAEELGEDILKKYKYMKYILSDDNIKEYTDCIKDPKSSKDECLEKLNDIFK